jgi:hypothetical protein
MEGGTERVWGKEGESDEWIEEIGKRLGVEKGGEGEYEGGGTLGMGQGGGR